MVMLGGPIGGEAGGLAAEVVEQLGEGDGVFSRFDAHGSAFGKWGVQRFIEDDGTIFDVSAIGHGQAPLGVDYSLRA
jgi:hypothetical protein